MSVLNQSGEEQVECPLCMEPLEVDDLHFYPCTCGYQICRFCWHRIRTDENGLCPACRKAYSENPADFTPLSQEQVAKLKAEKRQRDQQRKAKLTESRKHLASVRVVQRNLVFVVGLPMRLADAEVLKRHEYFGKFGKIHKVVINQSTTYAGAQGPSASAYVTYMKSDDALRAIQSVNNITIDGRLIKSSLGTTKYCSHFMKNQPCPKPDCMYLHDFGDPEASFTKEQMHAGKHQEYEKKLHENLVVRTANNNNQLSNMSEGKTSSLPIPTTNAATNNATSKSSSKENVPALSSSASSSSSTSSSTNGNKDSWPHLHNNGMTDVGKKEKTGKKSKLRGTSGDGSGKCKEKKETIGGPKGDCFSKTSDSSRNCKSETKESKNTSPSPPLSRNNDSISPTFVDVPQQLSQQSQSLLKIPSLLDDNSSFFSSNTFHKITPPGHDTVGEDSDGIQPPAQPLLTDTLPDIDTTEDWAAAFGFSRHSTNEHSIVDEIGKRNDLKLQATDRNGFPETLGQDTNTFTNGFFDSAPKFNVLDMLLSKQNGFSAPSGFKSHQDSPQQQPTLNSLNGLNGLDQNMSKFFSDFHNKTKEVQPHQQFPSNGFPPNGLHNQHNNGFFSGPGGANNSDRIGLLQQKHLEEHLLNLSIKQGYGGGNGSNSLYQNGLYPSSHYINGENGGFGVHNQLYGRSNVRTNNRSSEDDLGFDPIKETQKAFAELMANEPNHKTHSSTGRSQINGVVHNQNGGHLPPPPGFVQQNTHMNSFGSKILPFLNMSSGQQQLNNSTQSNWPNSFNSQLHQQQPQKNISNTCNDWKVLDPAILSSSRHYPLPNMPPVRDHVSSQLGTQQIQQNGTQLRSFDYGNNAFTNFTQQLQPNYNNFSHLNPQQNLNWFSSDINSQISSPPGFRNNPASKQQEC